DVGSQSRKTRDIQTYFARFVRDHAKVGVVELCPCFILGSGAELMEPCALGGVVVCMNGAATGKPSQRLHIRILIQVVGKAIAQVRLVPVVEGVVDAARQLILTRLISKDSAIALKLVHQERVSRARRRIDSQYIAEDAGASRGRKGGLAGEARYR